MRYFEKQSENTWSKPTTDFWNDNILQNIDYARYLAKHKYFVGSAGVKMGLNPGKIIMHDWSKLKPGKFDAYEDYFFGPKGIRSGKVDPEVHKNFRTHVEKHYRTEAHHNTKLGLPKDLQTEMESVADWWSVGRSQASMKGKEFPSFVEWWNMNKNKYLSNNQISKKVFDTIEKNLKYDYNLFTYTVDKVRGVFK